MSVRINAQPLLPVTEFETPRAGETTIAESGSRLVLGDSLRVLQSLPAESVRCCVTSPPYWGLRDYGIDGQVGAEPDVQEYVRHLGDVFDEVRRVLAADGTLWLNLGDS